MDIEDWKRKQTGVQNNQISTSGAQDYNYFSRRFWLYVI